MVYSTYIIFKNIQAYHFLFSQWNKTMIGENEKGFLNNKFYFGCTIPNLQCIPLNFVHFTKIVNDIQFDNFPFFAANDFNFRLEIV